MSYDDITKYNIQAAKFSQARKGLRKLIETTHIPMPISNSIQDLSALCFPLHLRLLTALHNRGALSLEECRNELRTSA